MEIGLTGYVIIAVLVVSGIFAMYKVSGSKRPCPYCHTMMPKKTVTCPHCHKKIPLGY